MFKIDSTTQNQFMILSFAACHLWAMSVVCMNPLLYGVFNQNIKKYAYLYFLLVIKFFQPPVRWIITNCSSRTNFSRSIFATIAESVVWLWNTSGFSFKTTSAVILQIDISPKNMPTNKFYFLSPFWYLLKYIIQLNYVFLLLNW